MSVPKGKGKRRRAARLAAVQALYEMDLVGHSLIEVLGAFSTRGATADLDGQEVAADSSLFQDLVKGVTERKDDLDRVLNEAMSGRTVDRLEVLMRSILRAGAYEIISRSDIDPPLTISEYLTVTSSFYGGGEPAFVNGVLDRLVKTVDADDFGVEDVPNLVGDEDTVPDDADESSDD